MTENYKENGNRSTTTGDLEKGIQLIQKELKKTKKKRNRIRKEYKAERNHLRDEVYSSKEDLRALKKHYERKERRLTDKIETLENDLQVTRLKLVQMQIEYENYQAITELRNHITGLEISNQLQHEFDTIMLRELMPDLFKKYGNKKLLQQQNPAKRLPSYTTDNLARSLYNSRQIADERQLSNRCDFIEVTYDEE